MDNKNLKLAYSPISNKIFVGKVYKKNPNLFRKDKVDVTSNFIEIMLQMFEPGFETDITLGDKKYRINIIEIE